MYFHSQSPVEQSHLVGALRFELGKVETPTVRERMLYLLSQIDQKHAADDQPRPMQNRLFCIFALKFGQSIIRETQRAYR